MQDDLSKLKLLDELPLLLVVLLRGLDVLEELLLWLLLLRPLDIISPKVEGLLLNKGLF